MLSRSLLFAVLSLLLVAPGASAAMFSDIVRVAGPADGVTTHREGDTFRLRFAPKAASVYHLVAGRRMLVGCAAVAPDARGDLSLEEGIVIPADAPRRRTTLRVGKPGDDLCVFSVWRNRFRPASNCVAPDGGEDQCIRFVVPLSVEGRLYVARFLRALDLSRAYELVGAEARDDRWPALAQLPRAVRSRLAALDAPDATPAAGRVGYWTDGRQVAFSVLDLAGRRLFFSETGPEGELVISTNVPELSGPSVPSLL